MTKTPRLLMMIAFGLSACAARPGRPTLAPQTRDEVTFKYMRGESLDQLASEYQLGDREDARAVVHDSLLVLQKRYFRDR